jgi:PIN domain nuclease of toxin-antitoxin system
MRYLIDTNIFIYASVEATLLSSDVLSIFEDYSNSIYISSESVKELIHLFQTEKITNKKSAIYLQQKIKNSRFH